MECSFHNMTGELMMVAPIKELSGRDKCALFNRLLDDLGIRERLILLRGDGNKVIKIIDQQLTKAWEEK